MDRAHEQAAGPVPIRQLHTIGSDSPYHVAFNSVAFLDDPAVDAGQAHTRAGHDAVQDERGLGSGWAWRHMRQKGFDIDVSFLNRFRAGRLH